jgi:hypothetical protein
MEVRIQSAQVGTDSRQLQAPRAAAVIALAANC